MLDVIVIGAGPGGLGVAAELKRRGLEVLIVERADAIADTWRSAYERLHLNTVRWLSHLPGKRMPKAFGRFPARLDYLRYLEDYAADLRLNIELGVNVETIELAEGGWRLQTGAGVREAREVIVATGYSNRPKKPVWPGRELFQGGIVHSSEYRNGAAYAGKHALVVGAGNSGGEIAADLVEHGAASVKLAVRTPPHIVRRQVAGVPGQLLTVAFRNAPSWVGDAVVNLTRRLSFNDLDGLGLPKPTAGALTRFRTEGATPMIDSGLVEALRAGDVEIVAGVRSLREREVELEDGSRVKADVIVAATGYERALEPLVGDLGVLDERGLPIRHGADEASERTRTAVYRIHGSDQRKSAGTAARRTADRGRCGARAPAPGAAAAPPARPRCCASTA